MDLFGELGHLALASRLKRLGELLQSQVSEVYDGALWYQRGRGRRMRLQPVAQDRFLVGDLDDFRIRFERDESGKVVRLVGLYPDGREEGNARGGE
ncbi:MAG TPA: hypothetical protein VN493_21425 [Thermoanaerobaculia bacterium]|nr:hypothetical protein [Thermoanaerobaculia bacterium]